MPQRTAFTATAVAASSALSGAVAATGCWQGQHLWRAGRPPTWLLAAAAAAARATPYFSPDVRGPSEASRAGARRFGPALAPTAPPLPRMPRPIASPVARGKGVRAAEQPPWNGAGAAERHASEGPRSHTHFCFAIAHTHTLALVGGSGGGSLLSGSESSSEGAMAPAGC